MTVSVRTIDSSQYENRMRQWDFDIVVASWGESLSPGNEQRGFWGSQAADIPGSRNLIGIKNPAVDTLIDRVIFAKDRDELVAATHALDRVLLWNYLRRAAVDLRHRCAPRAGTASAGRRPCRNTATQRSRRSGGGMRRRRPRCRRNLDQPPPCHCCMSAGAIAAAKFCRPRRRRPSNVTACRPSAISAIRRIFRISTTSTRTRPRAACSRRSAPNRQYNQSFQTFNSLNSYILKGDARAGHGIDLRHA